MSIPKRGILLLLLILGLINSAQALDLLNDKTYWYGNTYGGSDAEKHVQNHADDIFVGYDKIFTNSNWDEAGREAGFYSYDGQALEKCDNTHGWGRNGGRSVTADDNYLYVSMRQRGNDNWDQSKYPPDDTDWGVVARFDHSGDEAPWPEGMGYKGHFLIIDGSTGVRPEGLAVQDGILYVADAKSNRIKTFDSVTMAYLGEFGLEPVGDTPGEITFDEAGDLWIVHSNRHVVRKYDINGIYQGQEISDCQEPVDICPAPGQRLVVADNGVDRKQIRTYDVNGAPLLEETFGSSVFSGPNPGRVMDDKFSEITGVGLDPEGNLYVSDASIKHYNLKIRKFDPARNLIWTLDALEFLDCGDVDPGEDTAVYTRDSRYDIDYSAEAGRSWVHRSWTYDPIRYPNDPRFGGGTNWNTKMIRYMGRKYMVLRPMYDNHLALFRFEGDMAVPAVVFSRHSGQNKKNWPPHAPEGTAWFWVDHNGDGDFQADEFSEFDHSSRMWAMNVDNNLTLWLGEEKSARIHQYSLEEISSHDVPVYGPRITHEKPDSDISHLQRCLYDSTHDRMYLGVYSTARPKPSGHWGRAGTEIRRYDNWSSDPVYQYTIIPEYDKKPIALSLEGDYLFCGHVGGSPSTSIPNHNATIDVWQVADGDFVGTLGPTDEVGNSSGWLDMRHAISTHLRPDGTYVVIAEEDWKAKNIYYLWKPRSTGPAIETGKWYRLKNLQYNKYLDTQPNRVLRVEPKGTSDGATWQFEDAGEGYYYIDAKKEGRGYLDTSSNHVVSWKDFSTSDGHKWLPIALDDGTFRFRNKKNGREYLVADSDDSIKWNDGQTGADTQWVLIEVSE